MVKAHNEEVAMSFNQKGSLEYVQVNQDMAKPTPSPSHNQDRLHIENKWRTKGVYTPKAKLTFGIPELASPRAPSSVANANPFVALGEGNFGAEALIKIHEDLKEGWSFQGKRNHIPKISSPRQDPLVSRSHLALGRHARGGKEETDAL
jgi:hypothetical protein